MEDNSEIQNFDQAWCVRTTKVTSLYSVMMLAMNITCNHSDSD